VKSQVIGTVRPFPDRSWSILRGMAREGRWSRRRAAEVEVDEPVETGPTVPERRDDRAAER
jgi:hypothetical protein